ncbi:MAG: ATP-binding protein [Cytophagaceae bacterium]
MNDFTGKTRDQLIEEVKSLYKENRFLRAQSEKSSGSSENLARVILDEMYQFVALLDHEGKILEVNKTALEEGGIKLYNIAGKYFWEADWWRDNLKVQKQLEEAIYRSQKGEFVRYEVEIYGGASGTELIWIDFSLNPVRGQNGEIKYLLAEGRNITEKKQAEAEVLKQKEELEILYKKLKEFDELKTQFFANVSHELRTPLALILGPIRDVLKNKALSEEERANLEVVERNAGILLKQVNDLLDVAKLEAGKMSIRYVESDLVQLVRLLASNFEVLAREKNIEFEVHAPEKLPAQFDPEKIQRVALNLLSNAFKYTPEGGKILCKLESTGSKAVLSVADSGPGVNVENRKAIFERFRQLEGGSTRKFGGTGLGLAIVKDFLELHGGTIKVEQSSQGGAIFIAVFPVQAPRGTEVYKTAVQEAGFIDDVTAPVLNEIRPGVKQSQKISDKPETYPLVVVVEDNPDLNMFISKTLSEYYRVASALDGEEGLEKVRSLKPDLVISDVMMPRMSGDQMVEEIRKNTELDHIPILMLTAKADDNLRIKMLSGGVQDYLIKPFSADEVKARVKNLISMKKAKEALQGELNSKNENIEELVQQTIGHKKEVERKNVELSIVNNDLDNFIYTASHDLKAPISNLEGLLNSISETLERKLSEEEKEMIAMMNFSVNKFRNTINDLTDISRIQRSKNDTDLISLYDILDEVKNNLSLQIRECKASIHIDLKIKELQYSRKYLRSILYNLLSNAIKYKHPERDPVIHIRTYNQDKSVVLEVEDNGLGTDVNKKEKMFQMFRRLHSHVEGSGLGLYIIKRIVDNYGGSIEVESEIGKGTLFRLFFHPGEDD